LLLVFDRLHRRLNSTASSTPACARLIDQAFDRLNPILCHFYPEDGRHSILREHLLLASLLHAFYVIYSERLLLEQLNGNLLYRWFVGLSLDDPICHSTVLTKTVTAC